MLTKIKNEVFSLANWEFEIFQDDEGNYSFHGATVCDYFEIKNPSVSIQRNVDEEWRFKASVELGKGCDSWMLREPGLYQLAMVAKTPMAKKFQRWVYSDLLPKLRAEGGYIMPSATLEQLEGLQAQVEYQKGLVGSWESHLDTVIFESRKIQDTGKLRRHPELVAAAQIDLCGWAHFSLCNKEILKQLAEFHSPIDSGNWVPVCYFKGMFERATGRYIPVRVMTAWLAEFGYTVKDNNEGTFSYSVKMRKLGERAEKAAIAKFAEIKKQYEGKIWTVETQDKYHQVSQVN